MKQIYSALTAIALFTSFYSTAQINENFESTTSLPLICWNLQNTSFTTANNEVISGSQSITTHQINTSLIQTPYLILGTTLNVSFSYRLQSKLNNQATRLIEVGTMDKNNNFTTLASVLLSSASSFNTNLSFSETLNVTPGVARLSIRTSSGNGDGNSFLIYDNLVVNASLNYASYCNSAPVAVDDSYAPVFPNPISGNVLTNDNTPENNEVYSAVLVQNVEKGTLVLNANGTFTYTPALNFAGGPITFTYRINDGGFNPLTSNVATVTLNYAMQGTLTVLPVKLLNFSGNVVNQRAELKWTLEANETGEFIQVEKSTDGKTFAPSSIIMNTAKAGSENYSSTDASLLTATTYYRLKMVNKTGPFSYSKIIVLRNSTEAKASTITVLRNPVQASIVFNYTSTETGVATINVYNAAGLKMLSFQHTMQKGINSIDKPLPSNFNNGTYIMEVIKNNERSVVKLLK
ncbi:MAG: Ig-like domain-containing protein [Bacteroidota bacterium]|nr:Ig-like domain-containing protein [Bacteroidota bacterium]